MEHDSVTPTDKNAVRAITVTLADKNDARAVRRLADFLDDLGMLGWYERQQVRYLMEAWHDSIRYPEDEGSHPYDGAAFDTWSMLFEDVIAAHEWATVTVTQDGETEVVTLSR